MTKKNSEYWKKRFEIIESSSNSYGQDVYRQIEPAFNQAQREIQTQIDSWYNRVAVNNKISLSEAKKLLSAKELSEFKWDIKEFIKYGEENALDPIWMKELENASAKYHISRLEAMKIQTQQVMEKAFGNELDELDTMVKKVYTDDFYRSAYEIQKGLNVGWDVSRVDPRKLDKLISKPWAVDGKNFSDRVWQSKTSIVNELHNELVRNCMIGKSPDEAIKNMTKFVDGKFKNAKVQAGRLVMTEQAFFASAAQKDCFNELGVEEFEIVATLDSHTSEICQSMDGQHFPMKDYVPGSTAPPFHVWCRSTTVPYFNDEWSIGERAARGEDGKTYYVSSDMKYPEWKKKFVDGETKDDLPILEKPLTEKELTAVEYYVSGDGMYINDYLRNRDNPIERMGEMTDFDKELIQSLDNATNRHHDNSVLYRSVDASAIFGDITDNEWDLIREKMFYNVDNKAQSMIDDSIGKVITDKGFMSTTKDYDVVLDFDGFTGAEHPIIIEFSNAQKVKGLDLGKHMPDLDSTMEQSEVLINKNCKYKINSIISKDGHIHVNAEFIDDLQTNIPDSIIEPKKVDIKELTKLKNSKMSNDDYLEYYNLINDHNNSSIRTLYSNHADDINSVKLTKNGGVYKPSSNTLEFSYPQYDDMEKYSILAHEYGHYFDKKVDFDNIHFREIEAVRSATGLDVIFKDVVSSSDEFLEALRKDKEYIKSILTPDVKADLIKHNASNGVQDAIDGLFPKSRIKWGHGEKYYNRKYADVEFMDKVAGTSRVKELKKVYEHMGFDVSNQSKVKVICRQYETASEVWANVMSAEVCGGESLKYVKKYLPNSYQAMLEILKGVK